LHQWGEICHGGELLHAIDHRIGTEVGRGPPKLKIFMELQNIIAHQGRMPCAIFTKFSGFVDSFSLS